VRIIAIAGAALALLTIPVSAQQPGGGAPGMSLPGMKGDKPKPEEWHPTVKADEKAYKSALDAIPTKPKQAYDPWHNVRAAPPNNSK
jgi:hypothetical protein